MLEDFICNIYFVIALIIIIIVLFWLYIRKSDIEGMDTIDEPAWIGNEAKKYKFHKNMLKRKDQLYRKYVEKHPDKMMREYRCWRKKIGINPKPMDDRPDLGNCVSRDCPPCPPCKSDSEYNDLFDSESSEDNRYKHKSSKK